MTNSRLLCVRREEIVRRNPCFLGYQKKKLNGRKMHPVNQVADGDLTHTNALRKSGLSCVCRLQVTAESLHGGENIGLPYTFAIGRSYSALSQNWRVPKPSERTFLERALEALKDAHPREKATQVRLAKIAGVSQPAVFEWGLKDRAPAHPTVLRLAHRLNVCVEWLYTERGPKRPPVDIGDPLSPVLQDWPNLDPEIKRQIATYADFVKDSPRK